MKARLIPLYFHSDQDPDFTRQLGCLRSLLADAAEILPPAALGTALPEADAVVFPQILGDAYRRLEQFRAIPVPILVVTSEFGTVSMWDWEINRYLRSEGVPVIAPSSLEETLAICRMLALKRDLAQAKFLVFQDNPGDGFQPAIFKRFYWWEDECTRRMGDKFGVQVVKKSFRQLGETAGKISAAEAEAEWQRWQHRVNIGDITHRALLSAFKLYLAVRRELDQDPAIRGVGINCLNESRFCDTTPCLAWNLLYEERRLVWGCEADTMAILTKLLLNQSLNAPVMMTNLYPYLMGQAALKHERIPYFPEVAEQPENHLLAAHCGYFGVVPQSFSTEWTLRKKELAIVDDNATVIDARLPVGSITLAKLEPTMQTLSVVEAELERYAQFENSDCLNGAVIRVPDGPRLLRELASHHYIIMTGHHPTALHNLADVFGLEIRSL
jgi:hypothetical protein